MRSLCLILFAILINHVQLSAQCNITEPNSNASLVSTSFGQSFTPQCTGRMTSFSFEALSVTLPLIGTFEVYEGDNVTGTPVYTQSFDLSVVIGNNTITLDEPLEVFIKNQYTIELTLSLSVLAAISTSDPYTGGQLYAAGIAQAGDDLSFEVTIETVYPGGVSTDLALWLRADANTNTEIVGEAVTQWNDLSTNESNYSGTGADSQIGNGLGGDYPTISLSSNAPVLSSSELTFGEATLYVVVSHADQSVSNDFFGNLSTGDNVLKFEQETNTDAYGYTDGTGGNFSSSITSATDVPKIVSFEMTDFSNVLNIQELTNGVRQSNNVSLTSTVEVFSTQDIGGFAEVAEIVLYGGSNSSAGDRVKIESYLSMKYGMTPDQDLVATDNTVVWDYDLCLLYSNDIAVIGRDDATSLNLDASASINSDQIVSVVYDQPLTNLSFMAWGNDNGALDTPNEVDVDGTIIELRSDRVWKIDETGTVGPVDITFDMSMFPGSKTGTDLRLLIDRDGDGFAYNDVVPLSGTISGNLFTVVNVDFQDGDNFTVGSINKAQTPLPVTLLYFSVVAQGNGALLRWSTGSETDNDYFEIQRSTDGYDWQSLARIEGAGTTSGVSEYSYADENPGFSFVYYRLVQSDYDGGKEYLGIRQIRLKKTKAIIYPTLFSDQLYIRSQEPLKSVQLIDFNGLQVYKVVTKLHGLYHLQFGELRSGPYLVHLQYENHVEQVKVVKVSK